ncbi:beta-3-deoxy-D-manno-oct-2-ulosonic acid transferase [Actimicrobium sp. CCI2.3]|uniref:capsular polysaccharide export protein, LipB/KpsS family n=1 Tax=Actimicrobium sp. CCI2.3 TaxID=3048616 RepID=UPI002AB5B837|nr:beta-3-deoxy-D-manno-oct-2-ulosonic acid transferase [Actimicrobium sp. CCI2.3]MDY7573979.1 beta-3-deoxy-D-manno-oct-2-ulosonic acid transferase [Actimicrobium sp. CCI2.3]MEB0021913.1 beta-3-deoxy-D-manno-oct-2-ulosonic acid transferase [Actimicrobium sp. CCI2.3]
MTPSFADVSAVSGQLERALPPHVFAFGFSFRKRAIVRRFVGDVKVRFIWNSSAVSAGSALLLWGSTPLPAGLVPDVRVIRIEDGFLRSVGLGADLIAPVSWVMDQRGIYYDATRPSDLEFLLQHSEFSAELLARATSLRRRIVDTGLTKYNVGSGSWRCPQPGRRVILVPGQVEADASIRFGAPGISTNMALLQAVRTANPDAYVVYKPHPDVVAGLRARGQGEDEARRWCDEVVVHVAMADLLAAVDQVHVLTSLAGFEALLRGKRVTCYGLPFYAGWGLTEDVLPIPRRCRRLTLDALVAGALILYPVYLSRSKSEEKCTPEQALDALLAWRAATGDGLVLWRKVLRSVLRSVLGIAGRKR